MVKSLYDYGIWFNGHHSSEFGLDVLDGKQISFPSKNKVIVGIPHSNNVYDFSSLTGKQPYGERTFSIPFQIINRDLWSKESMYVMWTKVTNWLMNTQQKTPLYDDIMKDYYYMAEVQEEPDFNELRRSGTLVVTFKCYPFRIAELAEGNDIWDTFNFELDVAQKTKFTVNGSQMITLYNLGIPNLTPAISTNANMIITKNGKTFNAPAGTSKSIDFFLVSGENSLTITGNGTIEFKFYKELI